MILSIDKVNDLLDEMAERFPEALFDGLNGGVNLLEEAVPDPDFPAGEMYILGEYCQDLLGNYINLYYGSFAALAEQENWDEAAWEDELYTTLGSVLPSDLELIQVPVCDETKNIINETTEENGKQTEE